MRKNSKRKRSLTAKKAWATRRRREAAEFRRRSKASKKGWKRRKAKKKIEEEAKVKPKGKGRLAEFLVKWSYNSPTNGNSRIVDFTVIAQSKEDAELFVVKAVAAGQDSQGTDLTWMARIPWDEIFTMTAQEAELDERERKEIKALGAGWVEVT